MEIIHWVCTSLVALFTLGVLTNVITVSKDDPRKKEEK